MVEHALTGAGPPPEPGERRPGPRVPARTQRRWRARWRRPAGVLTQILATCGEAVWVALAAGLGPAATCADLVAAYAGMAGTAAGQRLASVTALLYRLQPRVRLM